ncbi:MAG: purine-nucleoside phosphorylase [Pseudomonadota bacterium]|nr:purine-nucleoside phosphorylase [Pseudomonadota bacterium]
MTIHINSDKNDISEVVLLPGDPLRAKWAAETFLTHVKVVNQVRGMLGFTGNWNGNKVTIQGSGMGMPSLSIYVNELIKTYGAKILIRVGSAGAMQNFVKLRDIVLATTASSISTPSKNIFKEINFAPSADFSLLTKAYNYALSGGHTVHVGGIYSSDTFYDERPDLNKEMERHGVLAVEMETAELYTLASRYGCKALALLTISDHLISEEKLSSENRERSFSEMIEIALHTAF